MRQWTVRFLIWSGLAMSLAAAVRAGASPWQPENCAEWRQVTAGLGPTINVVQTGWTCVDEGYSIRLISVGLR
jgi:hypothetical protein